MNLLRMRISLARRETVTFYLCLSPWLIGFSIFVLGPMLASLWISFTDWDLFTAPRYAGTSNYVHMVRNDPLFWQALRVTVIYTAAYVPTELVGGLALALLMNQPVRGIKLFRTIYYLPSVLSGVAFVVVWMWLFHPTAGLINATLPFLWRARATLAGRPPHSFAGALVDEH